MPPPTIPPSTISQDSSIGIVSDIIVRKLEWSVDSKRILLDFCVDADSPIGVEVFYNEHGSIDSTAFAHGTEVLLIRLGQAPHDGNSALLAERDFHFVGFHLARSAVMLYERMSWHFAGVDMFSSGLVTGDKVSPANILQKALGTSLDSFKVNAMWWQLPEVDDAGLINTCICAYLCSRAMANKMDFYRRLPRVDTRRITRDEFVCFTRMIRQVICLEFLEPLEAVNEYIKVNMRAKVGGVQIQNSRYKTRVRKSEQTMVRFTHENGQESLGRAVGSKGRQTNVIVSGKFRKAAGAVRDIRILGRAELTLADRERDGFWRHVLEGRQTIGRNRFIQALWFPSSIVPASGSLAKSRSRKQHDKPPQELSHLNKSQAAAALAMLEDDNQHVVMVQGPPGTGKTSTIAAAVRVWCKTSTPVWLSAQSNVGVKNIAEKLAKEGVQFRLIISKEFYEEWHEHIYVTVEDSLVRADELPKDPRHMDILFTGISVVLCTLSMLSNPTLLNRGVFKRVPVTRLVIDEASQICAAGYMHLFVKFRHLTKVAFFGDPEQLPPYGQEDIGDLQSVFDLPHLRNDCFFLNTQYRMPVPIGKFISNRVYGGKLRSCHNELNISCVSFVGVWGKGEQKAGHSWTNPDEALMIADLVAKYFRGRSDYCIITPYDAQRAKIVEVLKSRDLDWEEVYNVDSFQGNEKDYVIVSVVRTSQPGFLTKKPRLNVMLTRCRKGMVIVSNREFLGSAGRKTLLGRMFKNWEDQTAKGKIWIKKADILNRRATICGIGALPKQA